MRPESKWHPTKKKKKKDQPQEITVAAALVREA
jgi:hypothetical protein